ncbi:MAG: DUF4330 family protein [Clostridia bacterium]|nr:DUF4330 family protein [Clostridia bacterium]
MKKKEGKRIGLNVIDVVIILIILCVAATIIIRANIGDSMGLSSKSETAEVRFLASSVEHSSSDYFRGGDTVYYADSGKELGTLTADKTIVPAEIITELSDGSVVKTESPGADLVDLSGAFTSRGIFAQDGSFWLDGDTAVVPGMKIRVYTERICAEVTITEVRKSSS